MLTLPGLAVFALLAMGAEGASEPAERLSPDQFNLLADRLVHGESFKVRIQAALILGAGGGTAAEPLLRGVLLYDGAPSVRAAAALALADLGGSTVVAPLVEAMADDDAFVRSEAGKALALLSSRQGFDLAPALATALAAAPELAKPVGLHVLAGLGQAGADGIVQLLGDPSEAVRSVAEGELAALPAPQVGHALEQGLRVGSPAVRTAAARLAAERGEAALLPALADAVADATEVPEVQEAARRALQSLKGSIDGHAQADQLRQAADPQARIRALVLLATAAGPDAEPTCEAALQDASPLVQAYAVEALGELGDRRALPSLRGLLDKEERDPLHGVVTAAIHRIERSSPTAGTNP
jgi:HEAT repeat protein